MISSRPTRAGGLMVCAAAYAVAVVCAWLVARVFGEARSPGVVLLADLAGTVVVFLFSVGANNTSLYDPYWSVAPPLIALYGLSAGGAPSARAILCLGLVLVWSVRLTANWARRWQGLADEDWRYATHRKRRAYWPLSLVGFHLMPTLVVFLGCLALWPAMAEPGPALGIADVVAVAVTLGAIVIEGVADRQLHTFRRTAGAGGVLDRGLWAWSRHPNYFGEVLFWWGLWVFSLAAAPRWWWTLVGPAAITLLFITVSVPMMDRRMAARHPGYGTGSRARSSLVPLPPLPAPREP